jgi:hypothetical protein
MTPLIFSHKVLAEQILEQQRGDITVDDCRFLIAIADKPRTELSCSEWERLCFLIWEAHEAPELPVSGKEIRDALWSTGGVDG